MDGVLNGPCPDCRAHSGMRVEQKDLDRRCKKLEETDIEIFKNINGLRKTLVGFLISLVLVLLGLGGNIYATWAANQHNAEIIKTYSKQLVKEIQNLQNEVEK